MITYECYDKYGNLVATTQHDAINFKTVIIESGGKYYRPVCYNLSEPHIARCIEVNVISIKAEGNKHVAV